MEPDTIARTSSSNVHSAAKIPPSTFPIISTLSSDTSVSTLTRTMSPLLSVQQSVALLLKYRKSMMVSLLSGLCVVVGHDANGVDLPSYESTASTLGKYVNSHDFNFVVRRDWSMGHEEGIF